MNACFERAEATAAAFHSAADAWFWTVSALRARREGTRNSQGGLKRPCDPDDVVCCLDRLYRNRTIELRHARVLREWGERQMAPDGRVGAGEDAQLWREALGRLEGPLRAKGIVQIKENNPMKKGIKSLTGYGVQT